MKPVLIYNVTKYNLLEVEAIINKYNLLATSMVVDPEAFTPEMEKLLLRYSINIMLPLTSSDEGFGSVLDVETRNPGFEERVKKWPKHKLTILADIDNPNSIQNVQERSTAVLSLALSFPQNRVMLLRGDGLNETYFSVRRYLEELAFHDESLATDNIVFETTLQNRYNVLDVHFLKEIGVLGSIHV